MNWTEAYAAILNAHRIVIVTHPSPDGDAIGSLLGLGNQLRTLGKDVTCAVDEGVPAFLRFLPGWDTVVPQLTNGDWDLVITTDVGDLTRAGKVGDYALAHAPFVINIDHHPTNPRFGDIALVDPVAASASEIICEFWDQTNQSYDRTVAIPLLTGMVTDTLGFRTSSTTERTLMMATQLMRRGASLTEITARTLDTMNLHELELWKRVLPRVVVSGQVAHAVVALEDMAALGMDNATDAGLVQFLIRIEEVMISCIFKEHEPGVVRLSLRAKRGYDVASVAKALGGGGHVQASGATLRMSTEEAQAQVLPLLQEAISKGELSIV